MSDNDVTVEKVEAELFRILNGMSPLGAGGGGPARVEAARILLESLEKRALAKSGSTVEFAYPSTPASTPGG